MIPIRITGDETLEELRDKIKTFTEDLDDKLSALNVNIYDFVRDKSLIDQVVTSLDSDETDTDITAHEAGYDHDDLHTRGHAVDGSSDHTSTITENNMISADSNGLPDDSGFDKWRCSPRYALLVGL